MHKKFFSVFVIFFSVVCLTSCNDGTVISKVSQYTDYSFEGVSPVFVEKEPNENKYYKLSLLNNEYGNVLTFAYYESYLGFADIDSIGIGTISIGRLIQYKNDLYIDRTVLSPIMEKAELIEKERNRKYKLNECISIINMDNTYAKVKVVDFSISDSVISTDKSMQAYKITIEIEDAYIANDKNTVSYMHSIQTESGNIYDEFIYDSPNTVKTEIPLNETPTELRIKSLAYNNYIRNITLE